MSDLKALEADIGRPFDAEELQLIEQLKRLGKGPALFVRGDPHARSRRHPRGDRRINEKGEKIGPVWAEKDTPYDRAKAYLLRRKLSGNRASNLKKLTKAARLLG